MIYRTSFNGLSVETKGVFKAYNISKEEYEILYRKFNGQINGSKGNYAIYDNAHRYLWLKLFVHDQWKPIKFDIREDFLKVTGTQKIFEADIKRISKLLADARLAIYVMYDPKSDSYTLMEKDRFLTLLKDLLNQ
ncbi:MAG: hypothetical protein ACI4UX_03215 [Clostridia bacterium]